MRECKAGECYQPAYCERQGECGAKLPASEEARREAANIDMGPKLPDEAPDLVAVWEAKVKENEERYGTGTKPTTLMDLHDAMNPQTKPTNPKDALGIARCPLHLIPGPAIAETALAHLDGALKYGPYNWRSKGVMATVYVSAALRHIERWFNGLDYEPVSGAHELAHAIAGLNIVLDALATDNLIDDRPESVNMDAIFANVNMRVKELLNRADQ